MQLQAKFHPGSGARRAVYSFGIGIPILFAPIWFISGRLVDNGTIDYTERGVVITIAFAPAVVLIIIAMMIRRAMLVRRRATVELDAGTIHIRRIRPRKILLTGYVHDLEMEPFQLIGSPGGVHYTASLGGLALELKLGRQKVSVGSMGGGVSWEGSVPARYSSQWLLTPDDFVALARELGADRRWTLELPEAAH